MDITSFVFYVLASVSVASAFMVVSARNPVYSVLFLILTFFNAAGLFVLMGAEFLALILVVVYVGAVAVLFLFVVMMLDIDFAELNEGFLQYLPIGASVGLILLIELIMLYASSVIGGSGSPLPSATPEGMTNTQALGLVLYTEHIYFFQAAGAILLVAMIGAIVLTLEKRPSPRKQNIAKQNARTKKNGVELVDVKPGQGL